MGYSLLIFSVFFLYLMPTVIAAARRHRAANSILVVNLFLGWTLIGWVICLAWSVSANVEPKQPGEPKPAHEFWTNTKPGG